MKTLAAYFAKPDAMNASQLAAKIGVTKARISQLKGSQSWPPELALAVERETGGEVDAGQLSGVIADARATGAAASDQAA